MWKVHVSLTPPPPLLYFSPAHLLSLPSTRLSISSSPPHFLSPVFSSGIHHLHCPPFLPSFPFLSYCSGRSASLSRLSFNSLQHFARSPFCFISSRSLPVLSSIARVCYLPSSKKSSSLPSRPSYFELEICATIVSPETRCRDCKFLA